MKATREENESAANIDLGQRRAWFPIRILALAALWLPPHRL